MEFSEKIMLAKYIVEKILQENINDVVELYKKNEYISFEILNKRSSYTSDTMRMLSAFSLRDKGIMESWKYILNMKEFSSEAIINFNKQYLSAIEFDLLNKVETEKEKLLTTFPDKEFLQNRNCPKDILDRIDKAKEIYKNYATDFYCFQILLNLKTKILNCLEVLAKKRKIEIIGEWEGHNTRIIVTDWEKLYKLITVNEINSIPQEQNENIEPQEKEKLKKWLEDNESMKNSRNRSVKTIYRRMLALYYKKYTDMVNKDIIEKLKENGFNVQKQTLENDLRIAERNLFNKYLY